MHGESLGLRGAEVGNLCSRVTWLQATLLNHSDLYISTVNIPWYTVWWHNEELNDLYCSPNIVRVIKSRRMRWAGHVARMGEEKGAYRVLVGKLEGKRPLGET